MTQMRKFEQEAIATEIYEKIVVKQGIEQLELQKTKEYKALLSMVDEMSSLEEERNKLYKKVRDIKEKFNEGIASFNKTIPHTNFNLSSNYSYTNDTSTLCWTDNEWKVKQNIERKLAIALISPDWKDKLSTIIDDIASQFGA